MDSKSIRYANTRILVDQVGGITNFALKIKKSQSQTSQFAGENPIKGIGNKVAREIESVFGKPHGWLDTVQQVNTEKLGKLKQNLHTLNISIDVDVSKDKNQWIAQCAALQLSVQATSYDLLIIEFRQMAQKKLLEINVNFGSLKPILKFKHQVILD